MSSHLVSKDQRSGRLIRGTTAPAGAPGDADRCEYGGLVSKVPEADMRLLAEIVQHRFKGPRVLHDAWAAGQISDDGLRELIPDTWLYVDWLAPSGPKAHKHCTT
jgi:hypothetical protein